MTVQGMDDTLSPQKQHQDIQKIFLLYALWQLDLDLVCYHAESNN